MEMAKGNSQTAPSGLTGPHWPGENPHCVATVAMDEWSRINGIDLALFSGPCSGVDSAIIQRDAQSLSEADVIIN